MPQRLIQSVRAAALPLVISAISLGLPLPARANPGLTLAQANCPSADLNRSSPPFRCITPEMFRCIKANNDGGGGSVDYKGGTNGDIAVKSNVAGTVATLGFRYDAASQTLHLNVKRKNPAVPEGMIWDGFRNTIAQCRRSPRR